jgi:hypothetical protein
VAVKRLFPGLFPIQAWRFEPPGDSLLTAFAVSTARSGPRAVSTTGHRRG